MEALQEFESVVCSRCGGTGQYSYCQMYGTTCFKCRGRKIALTPRGVAAQAYYTRLLSKPACELVAGEKIYYNSPVGGSGWFAVLDVYPQSAERTGGAWSLDSEGNPVYRGWIVETTGVTLHIEDGSELQRVAHTAEEKQIAKRAALEYQSRLTKAGTERKR